MIGALIERLETLQILNLVAGAADFAAAAETAPPAMPAAYVLPQQEAASRNVLSCAVAQTVTASFGIVLALTNVTDAKGLAALADLKTVRGAVGPLLLGWTPDGETYSPLEYGGGALLGFKNGVLWWQDVYVTQFIIKT